MSNEYLQAAQDANRLLSGFAAVATVAAAFEKVGSLQQAQSEAEAALAALAPQVADAITQITRAEENMRAAEREALMIVANANFKAEAITTDAQLKADLVLSDAESNAAGAKAAAQAAVESSEQEITQAEAKRDAIYADCEALEIRANEARAYLAKLAG